MDYNKPFDLKEILESSKNDGSQLSQLGRAVELLKEI